MQIIYIIKNIIDDLIRNYDGLTVIFSCFFIVLESFIPIIPLVFFLSLNTLILGSNCGFLLSYIFCVIGSYLFFYFLRNIKIIVKHKSKKSNLNFVKTTILLSLPFVPNSLINLLVSLSNLSYKEYLIGLIIGKFFNTLFWCYVGESVYYSIKNVEMLILILIMIIISYIISKIIEKNEKRKVKWKIF